MKVKPNRLGAADIIIQKQGKIVLLKSAVGSFKGKWEIPGGKMDAGEAVEKTAVREAFEETGLKVKIVALLGVYSDPQRDPRCPSISAAFITKPVGGKLKGSGEGEVFWVDISKINGLKFGYDHKKILRDYKKWLKNKGTYWSGK